MPNLPRQCLVMTNVLWKQPMDSKALCMFLSTIEILENVKEQICSKIIRTQEEGKKTLEPVDGLLEDLYVDRYTIIKKDKLIATVVCCRIPEPDTVLETGWSVAKRQQLKWQPKHTHK